MKKILEAIALAFMATFLLLIISYFVFGIALYILEKTDSGWLYVGWAMFSIFLLCSLGISSQEANLEKMQALKKDEAEK